MISDSKYVIINDKPSYVNKKKLQEEYDAFVMRIEELKNRAMILKNNALNQLKHKAVDTHT